MPFPKQIIGTIAEIGAQEGDIVRLLYLGDNYEIPEGAGKSGLDLQGVVGREHVHFPDREPISISSDGTFYTMVEMHIDNMTEDQLTEDLTAARERIADLERQLAGYQSVEGAVEAYRHRKRGTIYRSLGQGRLQTDVPLEDYAELVAYRDIEDGSLWFRSPVEFHDGRFEKI